MNDIKEEGCFTHGEGDHWNYSLQICYKCREIVEKELSIKNKLYRFYGVDNDYSLIVEQCKHIERLQDSLNAVRQL